LGTRQVEIGQQQGFDPFHMIGGDAQPVRDRLFFDAFHAMDGGQAIAFGQ